MDISWMATRHDAKRRAQKFVFALEREDEDKAYMP
jgi:hypothetical protein